jgi:hypothetical protein
VTVAQQGDPLLGHFPQLGRRKHFGVLPPPQHPGQQLPLAGVGGLENDPVTVDAVFRRGRTDLAVPSEVPFDQPGDALAEEDRRAAGLPA